MPQETEAKEAIDQTALREIMTEYIHMRHMHPQDFDRVNDQNRRHLHPTARHESHSTAAACRIESKEFCHMPWNDGKRSPCIKSHGDIGALCRWAFNFCIEENRMALRIKPQSTHVYTGRLNQKTTARSLGIGPAYVMHTLLARR